MFRELEDYDKKPKNQIIALFFTRVVLWVIAFVSTVYWIHFSAALKAAGFLAPEEYSPRMRPVLYTCLIISIVAICVSFALYAVSKKIKKER